MCVSVMMRPGGRQRSKVPGDDSDGENSDSSGWNHEPQFRVTLNSATRNPETVVRTLSASSEECNSFAVVGDIEENPNAQKANNA